MDKKALYSAAVGGALVLVVTQVSSLRFDTQANADSKGVATPTSDVGRQYQSASNAARLIPFQAYVTDAGGRPLTGAHTFTFRLFDRADGGVAQPWTERHPTTGSPPVSVSQGLVNVILGSIMGFPDTISFDQQLYIEVQVDDGTPLTPRHEIVPAVYSLNSGLAANATLLGGLTSSQLVPPGIIVAWRGTVQDVPAGWALCDGTNGTPDLRDKFVLGAGSSFPVAAQGGASTLNLNHSHTVNSHFHRYRLKRYPMFTLSYAQNVAQGDDTRFKDEGDWDGVDEDDHIGETSSETPGTSSALSSNTLILPPYFALGYIMKL